MKKLFAILLTVTTLSTTTCFAKEITDYTTKNNIIYSGQKDNLLNEIYIKESGVGLFKKHKSIYLDFDGLPIDATEALIKVVDGDLKIKLNSPQKDKIELEVQRESTTASIICISNVRVSVSNDIPFGNYPLRLITENNANYPNNVFDDNKTKYIKLTQNFITVEQEKKFDPSFYSKKVTGTIGSNELLIQNNSKDFTMQIPTEVYLSKENRIMVPIRSFATILDERSHFQFDDKTKQLSLTIGPIIASMTIGNDVLHINGVSHTMTGKAVLYNGYTYVPLQDLGFIFGVKEDMIHYDEKTKTFTFNDNF